MVTSGNLPKPPCEATPPGCVTGRSELPQMGVPTVSVPHHSGRAGAHGPVLRRRCRSRTFTDATPVTEPPWIGRSPAGPSDRVEQVQVTGLFDGVPAVGGPEFAVDRPLVGFDGVDGGEQFGGDLVGLEHGR